VVTPEGRVKVLDFGLAKAWRENGTAAASDDSRSPTLANLSTAAGIIIGTIAYSSPEQVRGKPADRRADVWAFGVLLFEMLSGRRPFAGETVTDTLVAVLEREIDWSALPASTPRSVRRLLARCLVRDPRHRLHDIADARIELEHPGEMDAAPPSAVRPPLAVRVAPWVIAAAEAAWTAVAEVAPDDYAMWSPDGGTLYFTSARDGYVCLWGRRFDARSGRPVGEPFAVRHLHGRLSFEHEGWPAAAGRIAIPLVERTGNLWLMSRPGAP
jgi:hypothetical protein